MASIKDIPVEIVLEIVNHVVNEDLMLPNVDNAAWIMPPDSQIGWTESPSRMTPLKGMSHGVSSAMVDGIKQGGQEAESSQLRHPYCALKALRETNHFFDGICRPFLYRELNLLSDMTAIKRNSMNEVFQLPIWPLVQSISAYMDPTDPLDRAKFKQQDKTMGSILSECKNLTSLALYYRHTDVQTRFIGRSVSVLLRNGRLSSLGVYSCNVLRNPTACDLATGQVNGVVHLIERIALDAPAQRSLRVLDIVADCIPINTFDLIRSAFTSLSSLTLRRVVQSPWFISRIWDIDQQQKWHSYPNLTRLQLSNLQPAHAVHIPPLVRHFSALKELKVSACGTDNNPVRSTRAPGWSQLRDSLCNNHTTLTTFHVEHMDDWELYELGVIPTTVLIVTKVVKDHLLRPFHQDAEIFPGLRVLWLSPLPATRGLEPVGDAMDGNNMARKSSIQDVCNERKIELRHDAVSYLTWNEFGPLRIYELFWYPPSGARKDALSR